tara:strand:+ start:1038 stop:2237 length:1200 start_codon:yes stop_codon:yes gene_type:complete
MKETFPRSDGFDIDLSLGRITSALRDIGSPCQNIPGIQIVGTNGKGSITCFLESVLVESSINIGVITSPHLITWCERIKINGIKISENDLNKGFNKIKVISEKYKLTLYEKIIAIALNYFSTRDVDLLILEVGLGGRLDATTAHLYRPIIAFAAIGKDHCEYLGNTLSEIAIEKSAVINYGSTVISARQDPQVEKIIESISLQNNASLKWVEPLSEEWELGLPGSIQKENAAVAKGVLDCMKNMGWEIKEQQIKKGFGQANWPGRFQRIRWCNLLLLVDGAHNPHAAKQLNEERDLLLKTNKSVNWIIGIQIQKNAPEMLKLLIRPYDRCWIVPILDCKCWNKDQLIEKCPQLRGQILESVSVEKILIELDKKKPRNPVIITGSLYIIGDLLEKKLIEL